MRRLRRAVDVPSGASVLRRFTERMLQMAAETCIQIGIGVLAQEGARHPENYAEFSNVIRDFLRRAAQSQTDPSGQ